MVKRLSPADLVGAILISLGVLLTGILMAVAGGYRPSRNPRRNDRALCRRAAACVVLGSRRA